MESLISAMLSLQSGSFIDIVRMGKMKTFIAGVMVFFISHGAFSCESLSKNTLDALSSRLKSYVHTGETTSRIDFNVVPQACKRWSHAQRKTIVVKPYYQYTELGDADDDVHFGMLVAVVDDFDGSVVSIFNEQKMMIVDAVEPREVIIDTANYRINSSKFAFGVRVYRANSSRAGSIEEEVMNMYVTSDAGLRRIVRGLLLDSNIGESVDDCVYSGVRRAVYIAMDKNKSNGYFDMVVREKTKRERSVEINGICKRLRENMNVKRHVLQFNGDFYRIPESLQAENGLIL